VFPGFEIGYGDYKIHNQHKGSMCIPNQEVDPFISDNKIGERK
jgi:hypothetical protein